MRPGIVACRRSYLGVYWPGSYGVLVSFRSESAVKLVFLPEAVVRALDCCYVNSLGAGRTIFLRLYLLCRRFFDEGDV